MCFKTLCGGSLNDSEIDVPSSTWEEWIFAESRRRYRHPTPLSVLIMLTSSLVQPCLSLAAGRPGRLR
jgi:hypothetical protein